MPSIVDALKKKYKTAGAKGNTIAEVLSSMSTTPSSNIADAAKGFSESGKSNSSSETTEPEG